MMVRNNTDCGPDVVGGGRRGWRHAVVASRTDRPLGLTPSRGVQGVTAVTAHMRWASWVSAVGVGAGVGGRR